MLYIKINTIEGTKEFMISFRQLNNIMAELLDNKTREVTGENNKLIRKDHIIDFKVFVREDKKVHETASFEDFRIAQEN